MKRKYGSYLFIALSLIASSCHAMEDQWEKHWPEVVWKNAWVKSWVLGFSADYGDREAGTVAQVRYGNFPNIMPAYVVREYSSLGKIFGAFGGFQETRNNWLRGIEVNIDDHEMDTSLPFAFSDPSGLVGWTAKARYKRRLMAGLTARVGYQLADYIMPYVRLGAEVGRDTYWTSFSNNTNFVPGTTVREKTWVYRFLSGVGAEFPIYCTALSMRVEYNYHSKGKTLEADGIFTDGVLNPIYNSNLQPKTQSGRIAIVRKFS